MLLVFVFKQKTAYEMRISDWSSDVCSSDLQCYREDRQSQACAKSTKSGPDLPLESDSRVTVPQLFDSFRRSRFDGANPTPVEARKQRLELSVVQAHQTVPDIRPGEAMLFQPLVGHHQTAAIPVDQLQTIDRKSVV